MGTDCSRTRHKGGAPEQPTARSERTQRRCANTPCTSLHPGLRTQVLAASSICSPSSLQWASPGRALAECRCWISRAGTLHMQGSAHPCHCPSAAAALLHLSKSLVLLLASQPISHLSLGMKPKERQVWSSPSLPKSAKREKTTSAATQWGSSLCTEAFETFLHWGNCQVLLTSREHHRKMERTNMHQLYSLPWNQLCVGP